jgi:hypothetical protein
MQVLQWSVHYCLLSTKIGIYNQILLELHNIKFHEDPFSSSGIVKYEQTDVEKQISTFLMPVMEPS